METKTRENDQQSLTPAVIQQLMTAFLQSKALFVAVEMGLFRVLAESPRDLPELAKELGMEERPARALVQAVRGIGLVEMRDGYYVNSAAASKFLDPSSSEYMGDLAKHQDTHFRNFADLSEALRTNTSITGRVLSDGYSNEGAAETEDQHGTVRFVRALHSSALVQARALVETCPVEERRLVDLGCGSGAYSIAYAQAHPELRVTAVDYPMVCQTAGEYVEAEGLSGRVRLHPGDILRDPLPADPEAVLVSHVLDGYGTDAAVRLLTRVYEWMPPGGRLILHSHIAERAKSPFPYLFGLILVANTESGEVRDEATLKGWLSDIGFTDFEVRDVSPISSAVLARKPEGA